MNVSIWDFAGAQSGVVEQLTKDSRTLCFLIRRDYQGAWMADDDRQWIERQLDDDPCYLNRL